MIDVCEKLLMSHLSTHTVRVLFSDTMPMNFSESADGAVRAFPFLAGVRVGNKRLCEKRRQFPVQCVVQKSVPNARFVNIARFRIGDFEMLICRMRIFFRGKLAMERDKIRH